LKQVSFKSDFSVKNVVKEEKLPKERVADALTGDV